MATKRPKWTIDQLNLFVQGKTDKEIAELTGRRPNTVYVKRRTTQVQKMLKAATPKSKAVKQTRKIKQSPVESDLPQGPKNTFAVTFSGIAVVVDSDIYKGINFVNDRILPIRR